MGINYLPLLGVVALALEQREWNQIPKDLILGRSGQSTLDIHLIANTLSNPALLLHLASRPCLQIYIALENSPKLRHSCKCKLTYQACINRDKKI